MKSHISSKLRVLAAVSTLCLSSTSWALSIPVSDAMQGIGVGEGLTGEYWHAPAGSTGFNIASTLAYIASNPTPDGTFTATTMSYGVFGDGTLIQDVLGADGSSYSGLNADMSDGIVRLSGFIDIASPSTINFASNYDDSIQLKMGTVPLYAGGCCGTLSNLATYGQAGKYPIELVYSNTLHINAGGFFNLFMDTGAGFELVPSSILYQDVQPIPVPSALLLFGSGLLGMIEVARRKKTA